MKFIKVFNTQINQEMYLDPEHIVGFCYAQEGEEEGVIEVILSTGMAMKIKADLEQFYQRLV